MEKITKFKDIPKFTSAGSWYANYTLVSLVKFINEEIEEAGLQLNPEFQRGHVWTENQQTSGNTIYLNNPFWKDGKIPDIGKYVCVDGLQRITAAQRFINNEIRVFGSYYKEFEDRIPFGDVTMTLNVNDLKTEKEVLQWYIDMNAGGTPHTSAEIERVRKMIQEIG